MEDGSWKMKTKHSILSYENFGLFGVVVLSVFLSNAPVFADDAEESLALARGTDPMRGMSIPMARKSLTKPRFILVKTMARALAQV